MSSAAIQHSLEKKDYFLSVAAAIASYSSAGRAQPEVDDDAASDARRMGAGSYLRRRWATSESKCCSPNECRSKSDLFNFIIAYLAKCACSLGQIFT